VDERSRSALKEWAAIEQVLAAGRSPLLLRKGGLWERREGFEMEHREFWLFPTLYHQNPHELRPEHAWALESARAAHPDGDRIRLEHYAVVTDAFRVESLETLHRLAEHHALTEATVESRFHYRDRPYLHALVLRVHRIPRPHLIPNTLGYEGCVSWVELDEPLETTGAVPVVDDPQFAAVRAKILGALEGAVGVVPV
jgi:hypothetical protein